jgi:hypothetical protein
VEEAALDSALRELQPCAHAQWARTPRVEVETKPVPAFDGRPELTKSKAERESPQYIAYAGPFELLSVLTWYKVIDAGSVKHENEFQCLFRAVQQTRFYERRYRWTGSGPEHNPKILSGIRPDGTPIHRRHGNVIHAGEARIYLVDLGRDLAIGEEETIHTREKFIDSVGQFLPFSSYAVRKPLNRLEMRVSLPPELAKNVRFETHDLISNRATQPPTPLTRDLELGYFIYKIDSPAVGRNYSIHWL